MNVEYNSPTNLYGILIGSSESGELLRCSRLIFLSIATVVDACLGISVVGPAPLGDTEARRGL